MRIAIAASILIWAWTSGACPAGAEVEEHVADLRSRVPAVRVQAVCSLGRMADNSAVPALIEALGDPQSDVRREAAKALGFLKDARAVAPLVQVLRDRDVNVRFYAAYALGEIKEPRAAGALLAALRDPEWCVRDQAAWALREIGDPTIAKTLAAALAQKDADVPHIVWLLRHIGGTHAVEALAALLRAPDVEARLLAVRVLDELNDACAADALIAALKDQSAALRLGAIEALVRLREERARGPLEELAAGEADPVVHGAAQKAAVELSRHRDLAAHWSFDDRSTSVAKDVSGLGNDGQVRGCTPVEGKVGHALQFGQGSYVELGRPAGLPIAGTPFTVTAWVKSDAPHGVVVARGGAFCGFSLYIKDGVAKFGIHRVEEDPAYIAAGREQVVGSWVHLAGVVKEDRVEVYVNGKLAAAEKTPGYIPGNCGQGMEIGYDAGNSPAEITDYFQGVIDEVKQFQAALPEEEIAEQFGSDQ